MKCSSLIAKNGKSMHLQRKSLVGLALGQENQPEDNTILKVGFKRTKFFAGVIMHN